MRRMLLLADVVGLSIAFLLTEAVFVHAGWWPVDLSFETLLFVVTLPVWVVFAKVYGLYERDEERTDHSTVDDVVGVFHLVTVGIWLLYAAAWLTDVAHPPLEKLVGFWVVAVVAIPLARSVARAVSRRHPSYVQNTLVVGAGDVGQLVARKLRQHREYGIRLVGLVDADPRPLRSDLEGVPVLGPSERLTELVEEHDVERVVFAFSGEPHQRTLERVRSLDRLDVQVDIVPRLYDVLGPRIDVHSVEAVPLLGIRPVRLARSSAAIKRAIDVVGAGVALVLTAPLFAVIAVGVKRSSPGPVFFRQERLGMNMEPFEIFKFRTMRVDTDDAQHREYIRATMHAKAAPTANGLYKLERGSAITTFGRWLRRTSLDELPQLLNVLRGEMSLVGPRPCIAYETEHFAPHHFDRFLVRPGITGLWQVTARAHSTFGEALDMDVAYVRGWSLGLDIWLLGRTPLQLLRREGTA